jgi:RNA polymerase sigma factor (TIGR02999 family)
VGGVAARPYHTAGAPATGRGLRLAAFLWRLTLDGMADTHDPPRPAGDYLPLVYDELRALAAAYLAGEPAGHTLQPTALVHEAYIKLAARAGFPGRSHFLAAAGEAMRRLLVDHARRKRADKRGEGGRKIDIELDFVPGRPLDADDLIAVDDALARLAATDPTAANLAALRLFAGLSVDEAGDALGVPRATAFREWKYARAWLTTALADNPPES